MKLKKLLAAALACLLLSGCGGETPVQPPVSAPQGSAQAIVIPEWEQPEQSPVEEVPAPADSSEPLAEPQSDAITSATPKTENIPDPVEPEDAQITQMANTCTISISCATVLNNLDILTEGKEDLVSPDGWLLEPLEVEFNEGESVFHVLRRTCKQQNIHMEFEDTPIYNSAYIEGIGNLYEFDCGELSGWKYRVNGWFPNYGCSRYQVHSGDVIEWVYTCDLGADVGGGEFQ